MAVLVLAFVLAMLRLGTLLMSTPSQTPSASDHPHTSVLSTLSTTTTVPPTTTTTVLPTTTTTTGPGSLPQTSTFPSTGTPQFDAEMSALWNGIVADSVTTAMPAFFPEAAYVQLKAIADPQDDFTNRLVYYYGLDIGAAHALLGADAAQAQLVGVDTDAAYGHWVTPGTCDNSVGYFELPNSRIVYQENGETSSFGIASMISWRGEWYVVHLGSVLESGSEGVAADPESGPGSPTPSSTC